MAHVELAQTVVVLDLDDTLYPERDYHDSGMREVCRWVETLYGKTACDRVVELKLAGERDLLEAICVSAGLPVGVKESLLWVYRLHSPAIALPGPAGNLIKALEEACTAVLILTDGRSISQRLKLQALGLGHLRAYISEEYASEKPDPLRFRAIMLEYPAQKYVYLADNPAKDFLAPNSLGWRTVGLIGNSRNIHRTTVLEFPTGYLPHTWIESLGDFWDSLC